VPEGLADFRAGVLAVLDHRDVVHQHVGNAGGIVVRVLVDAFKVDDFVNHVMLGR
jgi:hypothetical protein